MDVREKVEALTSKLKADPQLLAKFHKEPVATLEKLLGVDLPDDQAKKVVEGVKAKLKLDDIDDTLGGLLGRK